MKIIVDANEARSGLAELLARDWAHVRVRRLPFGDVAVGDRVLIERKTAGDFVDSIAGGRLFRQAAGIARHASRPVILVEGDPGVIEARLDSGPLRGAYLALTVGFRIPILATRNLEDSARWIRHLAAQESKRETRRRRWEEQAATERKRAGGDDARETEPPPPIPDATLEALRALPGVGMERARAIATSVGSLKDLCALGMRELMKLPGIGPDTAARIYEALRGDRQD